MKHKKLKLVVLFITLLIWSFLILIDCTSCNVSTDAIYDSLMPNLWIIVVHVVASVLLFIVAIWMVWKPTSKAIKNKHDYISKDLYEAEKAKKEAFERLIEAEEKRKEAYMKAEEIIDNATSESYLQYDEIINIANKAADKIKLGATSEIEQLKENIAVDNEKKIAENALAIAKLILKREISAEDNEKIIDSYLKKY